MKMEEALTGGFYKDEIDKFDHKYDESKGTIITQFIQLPYAHSLLRMMVYNHIDTRGILYVVLVGYIRLLRCMKVIQFTDYTVVRVIVVVLNCSVLMSYR